jgi:hypothetical protein
MIIYLAKRGFGDTIGNWLDYFDAPSRDVFRVLFYEDLLDAETIPGGAIVISDIERLSEAERIFAEHIRRAAAATDESMPILNHPLRSLRRYDLLARLHDLEMNPVRVYRLDETNAPMRFPIFLRYEDDHTGALTDLLEDRRALDHAIVRARLHGHDLSRLLAVEFVDTSGPDGVYVKYGAFIVGTEVVARSLNINAHWMVKGPREGNPELEPASMAYVAENPHAERLLPFFAAAGISYGRIDYSLRGEEIIVWEINTNPLLFLPPEPQDTHATERQRLFATRMKAAFESWADDYEAPGPIDLSVIPDEVRAAARLHADSYVPSRLLAWGRRHKRLLEPMLGVAGTLVAPFDSRLVRRWRRKGFG